VELNPGTGRVGGNQNARFFPHFWLAAKKCVYLFTTCWRTAQHCSCNAHVAILDTLREGGKVPGVKLHSLCLLKRCQKERLNRGSGG
jgi:hypothetical protein